MQRSRKTGDNALIHLGSMLHEHSDLEFYSVAVDEDNVKDLEIYVHRECSAVVRADG